jgi:hypothetical protein
MPARADPDTPVLGLGRRPVRLNPTTIFPLLQMIESGLGERGARRSILEKWQGDGTNNANLIRPNCREDGLITKSGLSPTGSNSVFPRRLAPS